MGRSRIVALSARKLDVALKKPFGISGGAQVEARNVLVSIEVQGEVLGIGEGAPFPAFNGETQEMVLAACAAARPMLEGVDVADDATIIARVREACSGSPSAACAIETAIFDARARLAGVALDALLRGSELAPGSSAPRELITDITITTGSAEDAVLEARAFADFSTLKLKVGGGDVDRDVERVLAVRKERPDATILVDANGGFTVDDAVRFARAVASARVALFEQPVAATPGEDGWAALAEVRKRTGLLVAIDESVTTADDVSAAKRSGAADAVNVKIMKSGIFEALAIARRARAEGLDLMIGGMVETRLAMGTSACIALAIGGFRFVDLDTPLFMAEDPFIGGYAQRGERLDLGSVTAGHGLAVR